MPFCTSLLFLFFFFMQKTAYEITYGDWSSDVCSSDLAARRHSLAAAGAGPGRPVAAHAGPGCGRAAGGQRGGLEPLPKAQPQCTVTETSGHYAGGSRRRTIRDRAHERDLVVRAPAARQRDTDVPFGLVRSWERAKRLYLL